MALLSHKPLKGGRHGFLYDIVLRPDTPEEYRIHRVLVYPDRDDLREASGCYDFDNKVAAMLAWDSLEEEPPSSFGNRV